MSTTELNAVLQRVVDRSDNQKMIHIARVQAELHDLGYSIVTSEWLEAVFRQMTVEQLRQVLEKADTA